VIRAAPALALVCACWTGPVAEPASSSTPHAVVVRRKPPPAEPPASPAELAKRLMTSLRTPGDGLLVRTVDGPVVVLVTDPPSLQTMCGLVAESAAGQWAAMLSDPSRMEPLCSIVAPDHFTCRQFGLSVRSEPMLSLELSHDELGFRLLSVVTGVPSPASMAVIRTKMTELKAQVAAASCP
jgi:hypothetical protein